MLIVCINNLYFKIFLCKKQKADEKGLPLAKTKKLDYNCKEIILMGSNNMRNSDLHIPESEINEALAVCNRIRESFEGERKCFVESFGCQMNDHDAERLTGMLALMG